MLCRKQLSGWHVPGRRFKRQVLPPHCIVFRVSSALEEIINVFKDLAKTIDAEIARMGAKSLIGEGIGVSGLWIFVSEFCPPCRALKHLLILLMLYSVFGVRFRHVPSRL